MSVEDLLEFADQKPSARQRGVESDEVRIMNKVLKQQVSPFFTVPRRRTWFYILFSSGAAPFTFGCHPHVLDTWHLKNIHTVLELLRCSIYLFTTNKFYRRNKTNLLIKKVENFGKTSNWLVFTSFYDIIIKCSYYVAFAKSWH